MGLVMVAAASPAHAMHTNACLQQTRRHSCVQRIFPFPLHPPPRHTQSTMSEGELTGANTSVAIVGVDMAFTVLEDGGVEPYVVAVKEDEPMQVGGGGGAGGAGGGKGAG